MDPVSYQGGSRFSGLLIGLGIELFLCCLIDSLEHRSMTSIYQVLKELQDPKSLSSVALAVEREQSATVLTMRCKHSEGQRGLLLFSNPAVLLYLSARRRTRAASADPGLTFQSTEGDFKKSCVLRGPEKGSGENVSEAEVHQQNRPKETCRQLGTEGVTGTHEEEDTSYFWFQHDAACSLA